MIKTIKTSKDGKRQAHIQKYFKHWEVMLFVEHPVIKKYVLFSDSTFFVIHTKKELNRFLKNFLDAGIVKPYE